MDKTFTYEDFAGDVMDVRVVSASDGVRFHFDLTHDLGNGDGECVNVEMTLKAAENLVTFLLGHLPHNVEETL